MRRGAPLLVVALTGLFAVPTPAAEAPQRLETRLGSAGNLVWERGRGPALLVRPRRGDGWITLSRRYAGVSSAARVIDRANPRLARPMRDRRVRVPVTILRADLRLAATRRLFAADRRVEGGWEHWVLDPFGGGEESWAWLGELFCGRASAGPALRTANGGGDAPRRGRPVLVAEKLLLEVFRREPPVTTPTPQVTSSPTPTARPTPRPLPTASPVAPTTAAGGPLGYGADDAGEYAVYRLRGGEALYSAVVVRFTGQLHAKQVNATALEIARRSGISDVTSIPIGYPIRIPLELLLPEHLPPGHPRRLAWEQERRELAGLLEVVRAADLSGVHVIIDAGHGGSDTGAVVGGVWEATYAYDIACRIRADLERHTRARVWMTRRDRDLGLEPPGRDLVPQDRDQFLLTHPPYGLQDSTRGVHLRWYLTNDIVLRRVGRDVPRSRTVFISIHADSLHPSVRGAMAYVPSRYLRPASYSVKGKGLKRFEEYRANPVVRLSAAFKARAEASSRHLAGQIVASLERNELAVHPYEPIRDRVLRGRRSWVPAVLRYSLAQNAVLVECCNMGNGDDRAELLDRAWRERFARAVVEGVAAAFGVP